MPTHERQNVLPLIQNPLIQKSLFGLVVPRGNAPRSSGYQPGALLLSYETMVNCGLAPNRFTGRNTRFNRLRWPDSHGTIRFVTPAKEQLALVTQNGFHGTPFF